MGGKERYILDIYIISSQVTAHISTKMRTDIFVSPAFSRSMQQSRIFTSTIAKHPILALLYRCKLPCRTQVHQLARASPERKVPFPKRRKDYSHQPLQSTKLYTLNPLSKASNFLLNPGLGLLDLELLAFSFLSNPPLL